MVDKKKISLKEAINESLKKFKTEGGDISEGDTMIAVFNGDIITVDFDEHEGGLQMKILFGATPVDMTGFEIKKEGIVNTADHDGREVGSCERKKQILASVAGTQKAKKMGTTKNR